MGPFDQEMRDDIPRRGLQVQDPHATNLANGLKKWEVRNWAPKQSLKPGDDLDIVQCKVSKGVQLIRGTMEFEEFITFTDAGEFMRHADKHLWTWDNVRTRLAQWKRKVLVAWVMRNPRELVRPIAITAKSGS